MFSAAGYLLARHIGWVGEALSEYWRLHVTSLSWRRQILIAAYTKHNKESSETLRGLVSENGSMLIVEIFFAKGRTRGELLGCRSLCATWKLRDEAGMGLLMGGHSVK